MKFSTRLKYIFAALIMGAIVVLDHLWAGWLPDDYPYATWIHYGLLAPVGFRLAVSLGMKPRTQRLCHDLRSNSHTSARHTAGHEHGDRTEPFRASRGRSVHTMAVRTLIKDTSLGRR